MMILKNKVEKFIKWDMPGILLLFIFILFLLFVPLRIFSLDNDFWFLINTGRYIINNGFPMVEPFTIHSDLSFIVQQWLTDIIFYLIYNKFNVYGILFLVTFIYFFIILLIYKISMLVNNDNIKLSCLITFFVGILLNVYFMRTRPQIFDILLLLLEIYILELYIIKNNKLYLLGLPIISLLMINLHSSLWLMLFVFLIPYFVESAIKSKYFVNEQYNIKPLFIISLIMILIGLLNPYGIDSIVYLFNSYGVDYINNLVGEMFPLTIATNYGKVLFGFIFIIFLSFYCNRYEKIKIRYLLLFLGTCYLGLMHTRGNLFLVLISILCLNYNFRNYIGNSSKIKFWYNSEFMNKFISFLCVLLLCFYFIIIKNMNLVKNNEYFLSNFVDYLNKNADKDIKLYTGYNDGSYFEYMGYKCYLDPRAEVFLKVNNKKENILEEYVNLQRGLIDYRDFLNKYEFDYMVIAKYDVFYFLLEDYGYEIVYENNSLDFDKDYRLFKRIV